MARVSHSEVRAILSKDDSDDVSDEALAAYIAQAGAVLDARLGEVGAEPLPDATMKEIERNVAAHFAAQSLLPEGISNERTDDASTSYATPDNPFMATSFGRRAILLDSTGGLKDADKTEIRFHVL